MAINYTNSAEFAAAGYQAMTVDGVEYGEVRQYGNFSFMRVYESGHEVPYYQRMSKRSPDDVSVTKKLLAIASLQLFNRTINHFNIADGTEPVTADLSSSGEPSATHTEPYVPLPSSTSSAASAGAVFIPRYF